MSHNRAPKHQNPKKALAEALKDSNNDKLKALFKTPLDLVRLCARDGYKSADILDRMVIAETWFDELFENFSALKNFLTQARPFIEPDYHPIDSMYQMVKFFCGRLILNSPTRFARLIKDAGTFNDLQFLSRLL
jgi:hypothetical protein